MKALIGAHLKEIVKDSKHKEKKSKSASKSVSGNGEKELAKGGITKPVIDAAMYGRCN